MSGSRHIALYSHLMHCMGCRISDQRFCAEAEQMGADYRQHVAGFAADKREQMHDDFVRAVIRGWVKRWQDAERDKFFCDEESGMSAKDTDRLNFVIRKGDVIPVDGGYICLFRRGQNLLQTAVHVTARAAIDEAMQRDEKPLFPTTGKAVADRWNRATSRAGAA